jgi:hypothetical protein
MYASPLVKLKEDIIPLNLTTSGSLQTCSALRVTQIATPLTFLPSNNEIANPRGTLVAIF